MDKEFVSYKTALALKELGFNEECFDYYNPIEHKLNIFGVVNSKLDFSKAWIPAPLYQQAFRWFREKGIYFEIVTINVNKQYEISIPNDLITGFKTYEEAEQACLDKLIEICKTKTND